MFNVGTCRFLACLAVRLQVLSVSGSGYPGIPQSLVSGSKCFEPHVPCQGPLYSNTLKRGAVMAVSLPDHRQRCGVSCWQYGLAAAHLGMRLRINPSLLAHGHAIGVLLPDVQQCC